MIGGLMLDPDRFLSSILSFIEPSDFYYERHQRIFEVICELYEKGSPVDERTVQAQLEQSGDLELVGGLSYLASMDLDIPDLSRLETYAQIVRDRSQKRQLMTVAQELFSDCQEGDKSASDALMELMDKASVLGEKIEDEGFTLVHDSMVDTIHDIQNGADPAIPTGYTELDQMIHGLVPGQLLIVAGRPGMGKTSFAVNIAQYVAMKESRSVGIFSIEMGKKELALRVLCSEADVSMSKVKGQKVTSSEWNRLVEAMERFVTARIYVDDGGNPSVADIASKTKRMRDRGEIDVLVVDYLQLMGNSGSGRRRENRTLEVSEMTRAFKQLSKNLGIPIILLSQLNRASERRGDDHRPVLSDLRESGSIEQDADIVMFVYRDEYYHPDEPDNKGLAEIIVAKNRHGTTGTANLAFLGDITTFRNLERYATPPAGHGVTEDDFDEAPF